MKPLRTRGNDKAPKIEEPKTPPHNSSTGVILYDAVNLSPGSERKMAELGSPLRDIKNTQLTPNGTHYITNTSRKRRLKPIRNGSLFIHDYKQPELTDTDIEEITSYRKTRVSWISTVPVGLFATPHPHSLPLPNLENTDIETIELNSGRIEPIDVKMPTPKRHCTQKQVMDGKSAAEVTWEFYENLDPELKQELESKIPSNQIHWCHILAFCLVHNKLDPQQKSNLAAGSARFNYSQKSYEVMLRNLLREDSIQFMEVDGELKRFAETNIAISITLKVKLTLKSDAEIQFDLTFEANTQFTEPKSGADGLAKILECLIERSQEKHQMDSIVFNSI